MELTCTECGENATNFHSRCCGVHMEGVVTEKGELNVVCENCGKYVATIVDKKKLEEITMHIENMIIEWNDRTSLDDFKDFEEIYQVLCKIIGKDTKDLKKLYAGKVQREQEM